MRDLDDVTWKAHKIPIFLSRKGRPKLAADMRLDWQTAHATGTGTAGNLQLIVG